MVKIIITCVLLAIAVGCYILKQYCEFQLALYRIMNGTKALSKDIDELGEKLEKLSDKFVNLKDDSITDSLTEIYLFYMAIPSALLSYHNHIQKIKFFPRYVINPDKAIQKQIGRELDFLSETKKRLIALDKIGEQLA